MPPEQSIYVAETAVLVPPLLELPLTHAESSIGSPVGGWLKRGIDIAIALTALLVLFPLLAMIIILIWAYSRNGAIFGHQRVGYGGRAFRCLKFRTMVLNGDEVLARHFEKYPAARIEWESERKLRDDPRVTPIGRILRTTSLDELPQLINVLRGSMSIVGPRPIVTAEIDRYGAFYDAYMSCRPGITGLWQISGRSNCGYEKRVALDERYARQWSMLRDCWIIWKTVGVVVSREGSC